MSTPPPPTGGGWRSYLPTLSSLSNAGIQSRLLTYTLKRALGTFLFSSNDEEEARRLEVEMSGGAKVELRNGRLNVDAILERIPMPLPFKLLEARADLVSLTPALTGTRIELSGLRLLAAPLPPASTPTASPNVSVSFSTSSLAESLIPADTELEESLELPPSIDVESEGGLNGLLKKAIEAVLSGLEVKISDTELRIALPTEGHEWKEEVVLHLNEVLYSAPTSTIEVRGISAYAFHDAIPSESSLTGAETAEVIERIIQSRSQSVLSRPGLSSRQASFSSDVSDVSGYSDVSWEGGGGRDIPDDLFQSMVFSREEGQSLYLSAMSGRVGQSVMQPSRVGMESTAYQSMMDPSATYESALEFESEVREEDQGEKEQGERERSVTPTNSSTTTTTVGEGGGAGRRSVQFLRIDGSTTISLPTSASIDISLPLTTLQIDTTDDLATIMEVISGIVSAFVPTPEREEGVVGVKVECARLMLEVGGAAESVAVVLGGVRGEVGESGMQFRVGSVGMGEMLEVGNGPEGAAVTGSYMPKAGWRLTIGGIGTAFGLEETLAAVKTWTMKALEGWNRGKHEDELVKAREKLYEGFRPRRQVQAVRKRRNCRRREERGPGTRVVVGIPWVDVKVVDLYVKARVEGVEIEVNQWGVVSLRVKDGVVGDPAGAMEPITLGRVEVKFSADGDVEVEDDLTTVSFDSTSKKEAEDNVDVSLEKARERYADHIQGWMCKVEVAGVDVKVDKRVVNWVKSLAGRSSVLMERQFALDAVEEQQAGDGGVLLWSVREDVDVNIELGNRDDMSLVLRHPEGLVVVGGERGTLAFVEVADIGFEYGEEVIFRRSGARRTGSAAALLAGRVALSESKDVEAKLELRGALIEYRVEMPWIALLAQVFADEAGPTTTSTSPPASALALDMVLLDCAVALNPLGAPSKALLCIVEARVSGGRYLTSTDIRLDTEIRKASLLLIDDVANLASSPKRGLAPPDCLVWGKSLGYVFVASITSVKAGLGVRDGGKRIEVDVTNHLLLLESCADSTQTLIELINCLKPGVVESTELRYRTNSNSGDAELVDMLASVDESAFGPRLVTDEKAAINLPEDDVILDDVPTNLTFVESYYARSQTSPEGSSAHPSEDSLLGDSSKPLGKGRKGAYEAFDERVRMLDEEPIDMVDDHFRTGANADESTESIGTGPLRLKVHDFNILWNVHDGYDWAKTRDAIERAVHNVEVKAFEAQKKQKDRAFEELDEPEEIGDFLFNSIYVGIPPNQDPRSLSRHIGHVGDEASETASQASGSTSTYRPRRTSSSSTIRTLKHGRKQLKLFRSRRHRVQIDIRGVGADVLVMSPDSSEVLNRIYLTVRDFEVIDNVPTSTWKKFVTYLHDAGARETNSNMLEVELMNVKPVATLTASEIVAKVRVAPLRLHVDQDTLDLLTRFFEFKDESATNAGTAPAEVAFIQRFEVFSVPVKLDYKPKNVDYASLRSGRTTEFMNFFVLEESEMILRHSVLYGIPGFPRLGQTLNDIWMPDIKSTQLIDVVAGVGPIRAIVNLGGGLKNLVMLPIAEHKKDGRIGRSVGKGVVAFAKTTTSEAIKLGAKLAVGTQVMLQHAEEMLSAPQCPPVNDQDESDSDEEEAVPRVVSHYANPPTNVVQGVQRAYTSLAQNLGAARTTLLSLPGEIAERGSAQGAAEAVAKAIPVAVLKTLGGTSEAVGGLLMGLRNGMREEGWERSLQDKYKRGSAER
ncbi:autophagy-related protein 2 [Saitoella coloradoensis]